MNATRAITNPAMISHMALALKRVHARFYLMWLVGIASGLRISDILTLRPSHITSGSAFCMRESKTGKTKTIELDAELLSDARQYAERFRLKDDDYLFFSSLSRKHKPMSRQWAHRVISSTALKYGLENVGAHSMRKIYACNIYRSTRDLRAVQRALGHSHPSTTLIYVSDLLSA